MIYCILIAYGRSEGYNLPVYPSPQPCRTAVCQTLLDYPSQAVLRSRYSKLLPRALRLGYGRSYQRFEYPGTDKVHEQPPQRVLWPRSQITRTDLDVPRGCWRSIFLSSTLDLSTITHQYTMFTFSHKNISVANVFFV